MIYQGSLSTNQQLYLENKDQQTTITLVSISSGQQQSQSSSFPTGIWTTPPILFQSDVYFVLRIDSVQGTYFIQLQANGMSLLAQPPALIDADVIPLQKVADKDKSSSSSGRLEPLKPLQMGDMSMGFNPMEMRMGNMYLRMPDNSKQESSSKSPQNFCTQCGNLVKADDRFCGNCGHQLKD
jgi:ribosomal protein S27AE